MSTPEPPEGASEQPSPSAESRQPTRRLEQPAAGAAPGSAQASGLTGRLRRGFRRVPRRGWLVSGIVLLVLLVLGATLIGFARHHRHARGHWEGPGHTAFQHGLFDDGVMPDGGWRHDWHHGRHHGRGGLANTTGLVGSVVSTGNGTLVVAVDGGNQVTVPTNDRTRVFGAVSAVSGLQPGQRVLVRTGADKTAVAVFVPTARATGTITALDGDKATLTRLDGLTEPLDVSALNPKPKVGDMVAVQGTPADNGATLKAQTLRTLPKAS